MASSTEESKSHFMRLPPEIRLQIYGYLLPDQTIASNHSISSPLRRDNSRCTWAILRVSRRIHQETMPCLYQRCFFSHRLRCLLIKPYSFLDQDMEPEASFRLYIPRIRKLGLVIDSPYCPSASIARSTRRLYTVKDNIRYLCGCIANIHCLRELVIATSPALPLWPYTYSRLRKPPTKSDALHVMEPLSSLRNIRHVHFSDDHGRLFDDAADDEMKGIVRLMQSDMPPSAPHAAEVLWEAFKAWTFKFPDYDVVDEIWLARCAREERDLPGLQIAIDKLVEQMAGPMEANSKLQELRSVQQRVQELS